MIDLDKTAMGRRIKQIRLQAGMRQWELARILGTTQSAVHKYEHGVVPEPRRLVELARVGGTSIEWILTGSHWDNGSETQERLGPEVLQTAEVLRQIQAEEMPRIDEALRIVRAAAEALRSPADGNKSRVPIDALRDLSEETVRVLESAWRIQQSVARRVFGETATRLSVVPVGAVPAPADESEPS